MIRNRNIHNPDEPQMKCIPLCQPEGFFRRGLRTRVTNRKQLIYFIYAVACEVMKVVLVKDHAYMHAREMSYFM